MVVLRLDPLYTTVDVSLRLPHRAASSAIPLLTQPCSRWHCDVISAPITPVIDVISGPIPGAIARLSEHGKALDTVRCGSLSPDVPATTTNTATVEKYILARQYACIN